MRFWLLRYSINGTRREMGLGRAGEGPGDVTLAEVRQKTADMRKLIKAGIDPLAHREAEEARQKAAAQQAAAQGVTFKPVADLYMGAHEAGWRNAKHRDQRRNTLVTYAFPHFGDLPVGDVGTGHVMAALEPIWTDKPETATRVRGRIESVLGYPTSRGWRTGENPARWRGHLANLLPARGKVARVERFSRTTGGPILSAFRNVLAPPRSYVRRARPGEGHRDRAVVRLGAKHDVWLAPP